MAIRRVVKTETTIPTDIASPGSDYLNTLVTSINQGTLIPIIGNSMRIEHIFGTEQSLVERFSDRAELSDTELTADEELTKEWAKTIGYPMGDDHNLARVSQFYELAKQESLLAKTEYLTFLKSFLLNNEADESRQELVNRMRMQEALFSHIVTELGYPVFPHGMEDPLRTLAKLPFKIYITTSFYNFIERALELEKKKPRTEVCYWSRDKSYVKGENVLDLSKLSDREPLVYHLYGLEDLPQTLVLTEDDYMNFLISVVQDTNNSNPIVPLGLREALAEWRLLLLGYRVQDWDFRVLFRFILKYRSNPSAPKGILIQLQPSAKEMANKDKSVDYLRKYFGTKQFNVDWSNAERFIQKLWNEWDRRRKVAS